MNKGTKGKGTRDNSSIGILAFWHFEFKYLLGLKKPNAKMSLVPCPFVGNSEMEFIHKVIENERCVNLAVTRYFFIFKAL